MDAGARQLFVVVALFEPLAVATTFSRRAWPAHITLASNFTVDASAADVVRTVTAACTGRDPLITRFEGDAMFGRDHTVPVQLVQPEPFREFHEALADRLERLPGFAPHDPDYWRTGYRPHMTHVPESAVAAGEVAVLPHLALAGLTGATATVVALVPLSRD